MVEYKKIHWKRRTLIINKLCGNYFTAKPSTKVLEVREDSGLFWHTCKDTIFYKEGGEMASGTDMIGEHMVLGLKYEEGYIWYLLDTRPEGMVFTSVSLHEHFHECQTHTAQHLTSAVLDNVYKVEILAHHVGDEENDIEFSFRGFTDRMAFELQVLHNGLTHDDLGVSIQYPIKVEAGKMIKSRNFDRDDLRAVRIGALDYNMCGCMHAPPLRYLQMLYISGCEKTVKGHKIEYLVGDQPLNCVSRHYKVLDEANHSLAIPHLYINTGVNRLINETRQLNRDIVVWKQKYYEMFGKELGQSEEDIITHFFGDIDMKPEAGVAKCITEDCKKAVIFVTKTYDNVHVIVASYKNMDFDSTKVFKEIADAYHLRGGGSARLSQGGSIYSEEIIKFVETHRLP